MPLDISALLGATEGSRLFATTRGGVIMTSLDRGATWVNGQSAWSSRSLSGMLYAPTAAPENGFLEHTTCKGVTYKATPSRVAMNDSQNTWSTTWDCDCDTADVAEGK